MSGPSNKHGLRNILCPAIRAKHSSMLYFFIPLLITESICMSTRTLFFASFYSCSLLPENRADKIQESHRVGVRQTQQQTSGRTKLNACQEPEEKKNEKDSYLLIDHLKIENSFYSFPTNGHNSLTQQVIYIHNSLLWQ